MVAKENKRIFSLDFLRILAVCAVVMIHISADFLKEFDKTSVGFLWGNIFSALSRFAVPVFLMISGALMLDENKNLPTKKIMKATVNILILTFSWSLLYTVGYNVVKPIVFNEPINIINILGTFFNGHYHMWYLYVLVGLYLITPILRTFVKIENAGMIRNYLLFSIIICFAVSFINEFINIYNYGTNLFSEFILNFEFNYIYSYLIFYVMGWYIVRVGLKKITRIIIYVAGLLGALTTFVCTYFYYIKEMNCYFIENNSLNIFFYSLAIFVFVHYLFKNRQITLGKFSLKMSKLTFGVYLIHCIFLFALKMICENIENSLLAIFVIFVGGVGLSFVSVFVMSKIPLIKKMVRE